MAQEDLNQTLAQFKAQFGDKPRYDMLFDLIDAE